MTMRLQNMGWPHLIPKDKHRRQSRSLPFLKASPTQQLSERKATASDPFCKNSSEDATMEAVKPLQALEPRPELDPLSHILNPPIPATCLPELGTISSLSNQLVNKTMEASVISPLPQHSLDPAKPDNIIAKGISTQSIDEPGNATYDASKVSSTFGNVPNEKTSALSSQEAASSLSSINGKAIGASAYDGSPPKIISSKHSHIDHTPTSVIAPISDDTERIMSMELPTTDLKAAEIASLPGSSPKAPEKAQILVSTIRDNLPTPSILPMDSIMRITAIPSEQGVLKDVPGGQSPSILPRDVSRSATTPPMPSPNQSKTRKAKIRTRKIIRYARRLVFRKGVLRIILGKELAVPAAVALKAVSRREIESDI